MGPLAATARYLPTGDPDAAGDGSGCSGGGCQQRHGLVAGGAPPPPLSALPRPLTRSEAHKLTATASSLFLTALRDVQLQNETSTPFG
mmetsp:Transcript_193/g.565  ORF Transcript_193/g.565 Transcript_193/m.565 type:complete len:88 (-) Transcript_193:1797-2060(-)